jgi:hypothetical protein
MTRFQNVEPGGGMWWREWQKKPREKDRLSETKRLGCAGPKNELGFLGLLVLRR